MMAQLLAIYDNLDAKIKKIQTSTVVGPPGPAGPKGKDGVDGKNGKDGANGKDGRDGVNGTDGVNGSDGEDGISVVDARVEFDNSLTLVLSNGEEIDAGEINIASEGNTYYNVSMGGGGSSSGAFGEKGFVAPYEAAEALTANALCHLDTDGKMALAACQSLSEVSSLLALPIAALGTDDRGRFLLQGFAPVAGFTAGDILYVSQDSGVITNVRPENTGFFVRIVGYAISNAEIYFDPDKTWLELA